jgi:carbon storage regulator
MLVLSRKESERICIGDHIEIVVCQIGGRRVRLGISAPSEIGVFRKEILSKERNVTSTTE